MKIALPVIGLGLALAGLLQIGLAPTQSIRAADNQQESTKFQREVVGGRLVSIRPVADPIPDQRPVRRISEEDVRRWELDKSRPGVPRLPERTSETAGDGRPVRRQPETELRRLEEEKNRPGLRLVYRPAPGQGEPVVQVIH